MTWGYGSERKGRLVTWCSTVLQVPTSLHKLVQHTPNQPCPLQSLDLGAGSTPLGLYNIAGGVVERKRATADLPAYAMAAEMRFGNVVGD